MIVVILTIVIVAVIGLLWYARTKKTSTKKKSEDTPAEIPVEKTTLTIRSDGASTSTNIQSSGREGYMKIPGSMKPCRTGEPDDITGTVWCDSIGYDKDKHGMAYFYDLGFGGMGSHMFEENCVAVGTSGELQKCTEVIACADGGFGCAFTEEFDADGALISITNSEGLELLDVMANDAWGGKWDDWSFLHSEIKSIFKWENGKLILAKDENFGKAGTEFTLPMAIKNELPPTMYMVALLGSMKLANEKKPDEIILQIAGAKEVFDGRGREIVVDAQHKAPSTPGVMNQPEEA